METILARLNQARYPLTDRELWIALEREMPPTFTLFIHPSVKEGWVVKLIRFSGDEVMEVRGEWCADTLIEALGVFAFSKKNYSLTNYVRLAGRDGDSD